MKEIITMPKIGLNMEAGTIKKWYKQVGDTVSDGEALFSVTTGKMNSDVESKVSGVIAEIYAEVESTVACGEKVLMVEVDADSVSIEGSASDEPQSEELITMPKIGLNMEKGTIKKWYKQVGDSVTVGEALFSVETGKMNSDVESKFLGVIQEIYAEVEESVACGEKVLLMVVGTSNAASAAGTNDEAQGEEVVTMPKIGLNMEKGTIKKWYKAVGDAVTVGEALFSVTTGKMNSDVESKVSGVIAEIYAEVESTVACGEQVLKIAVGAGGGSSDKPTTSKSRAPKVTIIGGGPGGYVAAIKAAQMGSKVVLIEKEELGGTCLNVGCIPTKAILHCAEVYETCKHSEEAGVTTQGVSYDWNQIQNYKKTIVNQLTGGVASLMGVHGVEVIKGEAAFLNEKEIQVTAIDGSKQVVNYEKLILAVGSVPAVPPIPGLKENAACIDSTKALSLEKVPESMVIIGGGVIGMELACAYGKFGTKITVVEMQSKLMPMMDGELVSIAQKKSEDSGIKFLMDTQVLAVEEDPLGAKVKVKSKDGEESYLAAEKVLVAVGRRTNTEKLCLDQAGIANDRGRINVNDQLETSVANVYAIGDCVGKIMLAHVASAMGEVAVDNIFGAKKKFSTEVNPSCVYLTPEFAGVGLTEEEAKAKNIAYKVGRFPLMANGKSLIMGCDDGWVKVLSEQKTNKLIGCHILGPRATDLIAEPALAIAKGATVEDIEDLIHAHPTVAEAFREGVLALEGRAIHSI